jgi:GTP1/Obg family GTP-binding protein
MVEENRKVDIQRTDQLQQLREKVDEMGKSKVEVTRSDFNELQESLSNLARAGQQILTEQKILKSLRFRKMKERFEQISPAWKVTLQWVLSDSGPEHQEIKFIKWLEDSSQNQPPYWVGGKPGSGKSTLMKFICEHEKTIAALQKWAGSDPLVTASFFFWYHGTKMQKSQEGFLQTLLHEIFRK